MNYSFHKDYKESPSNSNSARKKSNPVKHVRLHEENICVRITPVSVLNGTITVTKQRRSVSLDYGRKKRKFEFLRSKRKEKSQRYNLLKTYTP
ncbi:hypothetical protein TNCT_480551 [Trichonephila clavata]|uniref:Uncharacterized protein n=1 Tax=Trichonephila clavata TaxID=2740835 RepID=A0A8X6HT89_TRICU|nr:hypothetical protein TNCT_480551 [Trichonephila clavata]